MSHRKTASEGGVTPLDTPTEESLSLVGHDFADTEYLLGLLALRLGISSPNLAYKCLML